jgi:dihydroorotate dehydrogenase
MQKETPLAAASKDYIQLMQAIYPYADYMAINISSPNTPGLRELQSRRYLDKLLSDIQEENGRLAAQRQLSGPKPLLVKISPDLSNAALDELLEVAADKRVAGIIATNTTLKRSNVKGNMRADQPGGLSGAPLRERSDELIAYIHGKTGGKLPIVGVGGVRSAADVQRKISCGAKLVQLYTGLVYEGPGLAGRIMRSLA